MSLKKEFKIIIDDTTLFFNLYKEILENDTNILLNNWNKQLSKNMQGNYSNFFDILNNKTTKNNNYPYFRIDLKKHRYSIIYRTTKDDYYNDFFNPHCEYNTKVNVLIRTNTLDRIIYLNEEKLILYVQFNTFLPMNQTDVLNDISSIYVLDSMLFPKILFAVSKETKKISLLKFSSYNDSLYLCNIVHDDLLFKDLRIETIKYYSNSIGYAIKNKYLINQEFKKLPYWVEPQNWK